MTPEFIRRYFTRRNAPLVCYFCKRTLLSKKEHQQLLNEAYKKHPIKHMSAWQAVQQEVHQSKYLAQNNRKSWQEIFEESRKIEADNVEDSTMNIEVPLNLQSPQYYCPECGVYLCSLCSVGHAMKKVEWTNYPKCPKCDSDMVDYKNY